MPIIDAPMDFHGTDVFVRLPAHFGKELYLKVEGFNFAHSMELKSAASMVEQAERDGRLQPGVTIIESSSGNMGVALAMIAASRGYGFVCVTDLHCAPASREIMAAFGARVELVTRPAGGGLLGARIHRVRELCTQPGTVWLNQYANAAAWQAHYRHTAPAIVSAFPELEVLFIGADATGTLMGCARYFQEYHPSTRVVAVGSVTLGGGCAPRGIPGLGDSTDPRLAASPVVQDLVWVSEIDTVRTCRELARAGLLVGGSTGSVVSGARAWCRAWGEDVRAMAISPDFGERYLGTIYNDSWVEKNFGPDALTQHPAPVGDGATA
jgi:cysteine synthase A